MYNVTLINLDREARTASKLLVPVERQGLDQAAVEELLRNFCEVDPVENATVDPEIRIQGVHGSFLIHLGQKKLILYDVRYRDLPGQTLTLAELMSEIDGTAGSTRTQALFVQAQAETQAPVAAPLSPPVSPPNPARFAALAFVACAMLGALAWLWWPQSRDDAPRPVRVAAPDLPPLFASYTGVYLTGNGPGHHGIALTSGGELTLFELRDVEAPRVIRPDARWSQRDGRLYLATNQPGGLIEAADKDTLIYCGETYRRIP